MRIAAPTFSIVSTAAIMLTAALPAQAADGQAVYKQNCAMCHEPGLANSPKFGDKAAWEPRVATGMDALKHSVLAGKNAMPPKGGNAKLTDEEALAAMSYMVDAVK